MARAWEGKNLVQGACSRQDNVRLVVLHDTLAKTDEIGPDAHSAARHEIDGHDFIVGERRLSCNLARSPQIFHSDSYRVKKQNKNNNKHENNMKTQVGREEESPKVHQQTVCDAIDVVNPVPRLAIVFHRDRSYSLVAKRPAQ